jgi:antirestriction protein ArdC
MDAFEELVAELGSAFLCSAFGIVNEPRPDHAAYIAHWLEILDNDCRAVFRAAKETSATVRLAQPPSEGCQEGFASYAEQPLPAPLHAVSL